MVTKYRFNAHALAAYRRLKRRRRKQNGLDGKPLQWLGKSDLAVIVDSDHYRLSPPRVIRTSGKRKLVIYNAMDTLELRTLADYISRDMDDRWCSNSFGFIEGSSQLRAANAVKYYAKQFQHPALATVDIVGAFDHVQLTYLRSQIPAVLSTTLAKRLLGFLSDNAEHFVSGLPQGSPLSPILFNIYLHAVDAGWYALHHYNYVRFADNFCLIGSNDYDLSMHLSRLERMLEMIGFTVRLESTSLFSDGTINWLGQQITI